MPPPTKIASGGAQSGGIFGERRGASPATMCSPGTPSEAALRGDHRRALRVALDRDRARRPRPARSHSIAIEPHPAPTSHRVSPGSGASARQRRGADFALGQLAVMLERIVGQAGQPRQRARVPGASSHSSAIVLRSAQLRSPQSTAVPWCDRARAGRRDARTRSAGSAPSPPRRAARRPGAGVVAVLGQQEAAGGAGARWRRRPSSGRPCRLSCRALGERPAEPRGGQAEGARAAARSSSRRGRKWRASITPTPYHSGIAARQHREPCCRAARRCRRSCRRAAAARGAARPGPAAPSPDGARRRPGSARSRRGQAPPGSSPASPSSPMPMTLSQRVILRLCRQRVDRSGGQRAAAAPACERDIGEARPSAGKPDQRLLGLGRADKADRKAEDEGRHAASRREDFEEAKQRGRRVADGDHRPRRGADATARPRRRCAWSCARRCASAGNAGSCKRADHLVAARQARCVMMPAATIALSTRIAAPLASARRPAATAPRDQARSSRIATSPTAWASRIASGRSAAGKRARSASAADQRERPAIDRGGIAQIAVRILLSRTPALWRSGRGREAGDSRFRGDGANFRAR